MGIRVRHDPPVATAGSLAVQVGLGARRDKNREFGQRDRQLDLQEQSIAAQVEMNRERIQAQLQSQASAQANNIESMLQQEELLQARMGFQDELAKGRFEFEYTAQQQREIEKNSQALAWVDQQVQSGAWTPEQGRQAQEQINAKFHGIQPVMTYNDEMTPEQEFKSRMFEIDGERYYVNAKGDPVPMNPKMSEADFNKQYNELFKSMTRTEDYMVGDEKHTRTVYPTANEIVGMIQARKAAFESLSNPQPQQPPTRNYGYTDPMTDAGVPEYVRQMYQQQGEQGQELVQTGENAYEIRERGQQAINPQAAQQDPIELLYAQAASGDVPGAIKAFKATEMAGDVRAVTQFVSDMAILSDPKASADKTIATAKKLFKEHFPELSGDMESKPSYKAKQNESAKNISKIIKLLGQKSGIREQRAKWTEQRKNR